MVLLHKRAGFDSGRATKILSGLLLGFWFHLTVALLPAAARTVLGVVRSPDNATQWSDIVDRLREMGTAYQTIDLQQLQRPQDLEGITVIFLPNLKGLTKEQVQLFQDWVSQGGRIIASGPIGNNASPSISQTLQALKVTYAAPTTDKGGFDSRWLKTVLEQNEPGAVTPTPPRVSPATAGAAIAGTWPVETKTTSTGGKPWSMDEEIPVSEDPAEQVAPPGAEVTAGPLPINALDAIALRQELENLIGRVESALLAVNAAAANPANLQSSQLKAMTIAPTAADQASPAGANALATARQLIRAFSESVEQGDYAMARRQWLQARQLLWDSYPLDQPFAQPEIRAVWLDRGTIVQAGSEKELALMFDRLAAARINTIFLETINAGYPIYPSKIAPRQNPLTKGWDPLAAAVKLAHERGMELHAWVWVFAAGNQKHNKLVQLPVSYPGPILEAHPDWANRDNQGRIVPLGQNKPFLDPANPEVRAYLLQIFTEIATRYEVDGLHLDYIRYPFQDPSADRTYGYGMAARQQFKRLTGVDPITLSPRNPDRSAQMLWQQWTDFRTQQVNSFVAEVAQTLRPKRPRLILSAAVFPISEFERLQKLQQQWEVWAREGNVDLIVPMSYAADTNRFQRIVQPWLMQVDLGGALVMPGIYLFKLPELMTIDQIQAIRNLSGGGYSLFAMQHFSDRLQLIFSQTQKLPQPIPQEPIPYRQPFATAAIRYAGLQREWEFLITRGKLRFREKELVNWRTQSEAVAVALSQLAEQPTPAHLDRAMELTGEFRGQFRDLLRLPALGQSYQVNTWENQLTAIDRLLQYGKRTAFRS
ncbi:hypothetical protein BST81_01890 [Leptolyngbya sp. 'hensonii']|uniref:glycoside hydrolase family 10 protein n=1 Tax=Leptolyngbya sp. 'hensonii' TaxID=1922337 RepID=UPI00094F516D|nr:family 10 glycosylhydrolase [Leptolyngbya sp. 'hensonii']OLP20207.1 hypothetical protein BST81_01890 [Leptolyngbya sp. 'hensonii']